MDIHKNARSCPASRVLLAQRVVIEGMSVVQAAEMAGISRQRAYRYIRRYRDGDGALLDRSSRPARSPLRTAEPIARRVVALRRERMTGSEIAQRVRLSRATVARLLGQAGLSRLKNLNPKEPPRRYEKDRPGELVHLDIKKLGRIRRVGHRITGNRRDTVRGAGWEFVHVAIDDASRLSYAEILPDECGATCVEFLRRSIIFFAAHGVELERLLTDNGPGYISKVFAQACSSLALGHSFTRPYRPQTNGKAERLIQTLLREWAYRRPYRTSRQRSNRLLRFLRYYNHHRPHASLNRNPPASRLPVNNLMRLDS
jgi:transposase InsO family protein